MKKIIFTVFALFWGGIRLMADSAEITTADSKMDPGGGELVLAVRVEYETTPAALGAQLGLPAGWSLISVSGRTPPEIAPQTGTTNRLEFAWTNAPGDQVNFEITVAYPAGAPAVNLSGEVIIRAKGKPTRLPVSVLVE